MTRTFLNRSRALVLTVALSTAAWAGTFGKVVDIGGQGSDLALDEARGVLYIANFTAGRVDVMSLSDHTVHRSMNVASQPGSLALSPDGQYLVVTHYGNFAAPGSPNNALTVVDLRTNAKQTYGMGNPPLGVAFGIDGRAFIATTTEFISFDPISGSMQTLETVAALVAKTLPQPQGSAPSTIVATSLGVSGDGITIYGLNDKFKFRYDSNAKILRITGYTASPALGPRAVSVNRDGSLWIGGWSMNAASGGIISEFQDPSGALDIGSVQIDSRRNLAYAQMGTTTANPTPILQVTDLDNLTVRERLNLAENLSGKSVLSNDSSTMYSISESGVTVLPVGSLSAEPRVLASSQDLVFRGNFCDRTINTQEITISSEGAPADFRLSSDNPGVRISPATGVTPATVRISVDPNTFQNQKGTTVANLTLESSVGVNRPSPIRVLINSREPDQRGTSINIPGKLVDIVADVDRDRFFVLRQDTNEVLVFDGTTNSQIASLRTYNTPKSMAITFDRRYLLIGCDKSHFVSVYDLETLQQGRSILVRDYVQSLAVSSRSVLAATRSSAGVDNQIHRLDVASGTSTPLPSLGVFENKILTNTVMVGSPNGRSILVAQADGNLMLYNAVQDTFTVSRKESAAITGAFAASNNDRFVVGNLLLNSSLGRMRTLETSGGKSSGFSFIDEGGFFITAPATSAPGVLSRVDLTSGSGIRPTRTIEAPILNDTTQAFTRTLAPLYGRNAIIALTVSGVTVFPWTYDNATAPPRIDRIVNAADLSAPVAPGSLISVFGNDLSPVSQASRQIPLPTALGDSCLTVNGVPVPIMFVSPRQINAQLPYAVDGSTTLQLRTPGGVSDNFNVTITPTAPSVFRNGTAGPETSIAAVVRATNNQVVTPSNPIHRADTLTIYATGLGRTSPAVETGVPAPSDPLASVIIPPNVSIGGVPVEVTFAGLSPGEIGIYQINVRVGGNVPLGFDLPLQINQAGNATSVPVRVVRD